MLKAYNLTHNSRKSFESVQVSTEIISRSIPFFFLTLINLFLYTRHYKLSTFPCVKYGWDTNNPHAVNLMWKGENKIDVIYCIPSSCNKPDSISGYSDLNLGKMK
jgi:hypothetical protein